MNLISHIEKTKKKQYRDQANMVYFGAVVSYVFIVPLSFFMDNLIASIYMIFAMFISGLSLYLNSQNRYSISSWLFILTMTFGTVLNSIIFGFGGGFAFYFFNISVLIVFTLWKGLTKFIAIIIEVSLFIILAIYQVYNAPITLLTTNMTIVFLILNITLNIAGVANSSYVYLKIATSAQKDLRKFAETDFLTTLPNRGAFHHYISQLDLNKTSKNINHGIIMFDIDNFKRINDQYGHPIGDRVLVRVSEILKSLINPKDFLARHGGEEFVIVHFAQNEAEIATFVERLRKEIENTSIKVDEHIIKFTASFGVVYRTSLVVNYDQAISLADTLLYEAKAAGRNCIKTKTI